MKQYWKFIVGALAALLVLMLFATYPYHNRLEVYPFLSGSDTLGDPANVDTIAWQLRASGLNWPDSWNKPTTYITAANKSNEASVNYHLENETLFGWADEIRIRILSASGDTLTSGAIFIGDREGKILLAVQPDTCTTCSSSAGDTTIYLVRLKGQ